MKRLTLPLVDDAACTTDLSKNTRLSKTSYPHLKDQLPEILAAYDDYMASNGNALNIALPGLSDELKQGLSSNYDGPPKNLPYIKEIRGSSPDVCPMCGSLQTSTLDHLLPQESYAEFAIYSRNLVPACDCNSKRGTALMDLTTSSRVLHPYFDDCLQDRLISCEILPAPGFPLVDIKPRYVDPTHQLADSIEFHVEKIVLRSGLLVWLSSQWDSARIRPINKIHTLPRKVVGSSNAMRLCLEDALTRYDQNYASPNNWESIFIHGLLGSPDAMEWLRLRHNVDILNT